jgi:hypothetical protein
MLMLRETGPSPTPFLSCRYRYLNRTFTVMLREIGLSLIFQYLQRTFMVMLRDTGPSPILRILTEDIYADAARDRT